MLMVFNFLVFAMVLDLMSRQLHGRAYRLIGGLVS